MGHKHLQLFNIRRKFLNEMRCFVLCMKKKLLVEMRFKKKIKLAILSFFTHTKRNPNKNVNRMPPHFICERKVS